MPVALEAGQAPPQQLLLHFERWLLLLKARPLIPISLSIIANTRRGHACCCQTATWLRGQALTRSYWASHVVAGPALLQPEARGHGSTAACKAATCIHAMRLVSLAPAPGPRTLCRCCGGLSCSAMSATACRCSRCRPWSAACRQRCRRCARCARCGSSQPAPAAHAASWRPCWTAPCCSLLRRSPRCSKRTPGALRRCCMLRQASLSCGTTEPLCTCSGPAVGDALRHGQARFELQKPSPAVRLQC